ncbi:hypothetical protein [Glutamicibacter protophormiae]|uniref:Uncharacterized protein n=1 Tax=Glutamicibacter protophormiae TaxID=37930 RepID=A0ABS4XTA1_GLUPR|nr:hypothetical protein [Glutamicibacter protophormiae]MBP2398968.1 hypothetical protein [Glutamicibacter protophormiae]
MSETSEGATSGNRGPLLPVARSFPVHVDNLLLVGWAIRSDALLVQAGGMGGSVLVDIHGNRVNPAKIRDVGQQLNGWEPWTLLVLETGILHVGHDAFPPGFEGFDHDDELGDSPWCRFFPWLPEC